jgi:hypothetical protein
VGPAAANGANGTASIVAAAEGGVRERAAGGGAGAGGGGVGRTGAGTGVRRRESGKSHR